jgi:serine/threonine protein kinase
VYIFGSEEIEGMPVISMELLPGGTLKERVAANGPMPPEEAVAAVMDIIGGLDAAQAAGVLHRDIKPSNCFIDADGAVKVGDFGLSISTLARDVHHDLETGAFQGTPQFAPPEQLRGEPLDIRADIYAVGATLYYLLTGQPPFDARDLRELVSRVTSEPPRSPRVLRRGIPAGLASVVLQCLAKIPGERPKSYADLACRSCVRSCRPQTCRQSRDCASWQVLLTASSCLFPLSRCLFSQPVSRLRGQRRIPWRFGRLSRLAFFTGSYSRVCGGPRWARCFSAFECGPQTARARHGGAS